jgi:hypothetical protein
MTALVFVIIGIALEVFLLYRPPLVTRALGTVTNRGCTSDLRVGGSGELTIVPLQFVTPTAIAVWSDGTWDRFLWQSNHSTPSSISGGNAVTRPFRAVA